ncbi:nucleotide-binding universal stress UspA family protein [Halarchaeum rubridurum]|uniref:Nucleotide-binding universal stress UspA family protein n=1 Tax=Halarchaeum rubridurum TaxID=489911 RepID=A0A830FSZ7_9EURY|nr:universal stress protein [Halarchaeum rubridurum]MBP1954017.1 nucleotide-binding universal stress UspA family protein [Halarchaeum rubridurum]GGM56697.1 universal stress protein UspA [Halarchaeum rubridurum]
MYDRILVPTDGSPESEDAIDEAMELAELTGATVVALYVVDTRDYSSLPESKWSTLQDELYAEGEEAVAAVAERGDEAGVAVEEVVAEGSPHEVILDTATEEECDAVVMGTHGRSGVERFLLGSVTERVVRHAEIPVMVVRVEG